jgi:F420-non-reducing hydrogenase iron-sulfur subunit
MNPESKPKIEIFYCVNALEQGMHPQGAEIVNGVRMACSAMIKDVYILKAFESGADGVLIVGCPAGKCKRVDGNLRAAKRVAFVQKLLDEIGLGARRLIYVSSDDASAALAALVDKLVAMGPRKVGDHDQIET